MITLHRTSYEKCSSTQHSGISSFGNLIPFLTIKNNLRSRLVQGHRHPPLVRLHLAYPEAKNPVRYRQRHLGKDIDHISYPGAISAGNKVAPGTLFRTRNPTITQGTILLTKRNSPALKD